MLAAVDCTDRGNSAVCEKFGVKSYPKIKYLNYGKLGFDYNAGRKADDFVNFLNDPQVCRLFFGALLWYVCVCVFVV